MYQALLAKKLVSVLATSMSMIGAKEAQKMRFLD